MPDADLGLTGFHHLTAVTARAAGNLAFYTQVLGMRLVKKTVNQDDVSAYHLFYADGQASPGTDITFFDWPAAPERRGTRCVVQTGLRVAGHKSLAWWKARFVELKVRHGQVVEHDGRHVLDFDDPEGQRLSLVDDRGVGPAHPWEGSTVPAEHQIRGLGPVRISVPDLKPTDRVLTSVMNLASVRTYELPTENPTAVHVYRMKGEGPACELHVAVEPNLAPARLGAGGVHHVAFRTPNDEEYEAWEERLNALGVPTSGPVDRYYFRSLYFRETGGTLFEIATDGPGFATDEPMEKLGERLALPPFLEPRRKEIEAGLKPLAPEVTWEAKRPQDSCRRLDGVARWSFFSSALSARVETPHPPKRCKRFKPVRNAFGRMIVEEANPPIAVVFAGSLCHSESLGPILPHRERRRCHAVKMSSALDRSWQVSGPGFPIALPYPARNLGPQT